MNNINMELQKKIRDLPEVEQELIYDLLESIRENKKEHYIKAQLRTKIKQICNGKEAK